MRLIYPRPEWSRRCLRLWRRWHLIWCNECRGRYSFRTGKGIPLQQQRTKR